RAERLEALLAGGEKFDFSRFKAMQLDSHRAHALAMIKDALPLLDNGLFAEKQRTLADAARQLLTDWDGNFQAGSAAALIYQRWEHILMAALFSDELCELYSHFCDTSMSRMSLASLYWKPASPWCDNRQQPSMDGRQASIEQSCVRTLDSLI